MKGRKKLLKASAIRQSFTRFGLKLWTGIVVFAGSFFLLALLTNEIQEGENSTDIQVFRLLGDITSPNVTETMKIITFFGSPYFLLPAYLLLCFYFLFIRHNKWVSVIVTVTGLIGTLILFAGKYFFKRQRPPDPLISAVHGFSFPSGHSFSAFTFFGLLIYLLSTAPITTFFRWLFGAICFFTATAVAISRVYLHVHYASDVIAGFLLCVSWLSFSIWLFSRLQQPGKMTW